MVTIECPWCDAALPVDGADTVRCDPCRVELTFAPDPPPEALPIAA